MPDHSGPEYAATLARMLEECNLIRKNGFFAMRDALRYSPEMLKNCGYRTNEEAVVKLFKYYQEQLDKVTRNFLRKYPD